MSGSVQASCAIGECVRSSRPGRRKPAPKVSTLRWFSRGGWTETGLGTGNGEEGQCPLVEGTRGKFWKCRTTRIPSLCLRFRTDQLLFP